MIKKTIITMMLALVTMEGQAQTKTATITGYSPALKDGTLVIGGAGTSWEIVDSVRAGHFSLTIPVEGLTVGGMACIDDGCLNYSLNLMLKPGVTVTVSGTDCLFPLWKVESPIPEQQTLNRIRDYSRETIVDFFKIEQNRDMAKFDSINLVLMKQELDILSSLPVDVASISKLSNIASMLKNMKDFPYMEQLKNLEKTFAARAPKGFEAQLAEIHTYIYPPKVLQLGDEAVDAELFDMQGKKHHLFDAFADGRYVLLDFWGIGCGPCRMSEPEMREVYERMKGKLEIIGINEDDVSNWKNSDFSKSIIWKNWNDGMRGSSVNSIYCDMGAIPYYVLITPDKRIVWKAMGYNPGWFLGIADVVNGLRIKQDNSANYHFSVRQINTNANGTTIKFRYYGNKDYWFRIVKESYLEANGKRYRLMTADGITLDENNYPAVKATDATNGFQSGLNYSEFTLSFEPFETIPQTFDFKEGDGEGAFVIRNISVN
ncbi:MAG: TlpA disulfide reductase family protein [Prevotella sp.]|nr:TlpA disulfide reductase family protein [Prevotella sp.]